jgi:hypothetical protein
VTSAPLVGEASAGLLMATGTRCPGVADALRVGGREVGLAVTMRRGVAVVVKVTRVVAIREGVTVMVALAVASVVGVALGVVAVGFVNSGRPSAPVAASRVTITALVGWTARPSGAGVSGSPPISVVAAGSRVVLGRGVDMASATVGTKGAWSSPFLGTRIHGAATLTTITRAAISKFGRTARAPKRDMDKCDPC